MKITSNFDSGNIEIVNIDVKKNVFKLKIRKDTNSDFLQWFHFRLTGELGSMVNSYNQCRKTTYPVDGKLQPALRMIGSRASGTTTFRNGILI